MSWFQLWWSGCKDFITSLLPNTLDPLQLKLEILGLTTSLCQWISNFQTDRQTTSIMLGRHVSPSLTFSTGVPQGCVLSPVLYSLQTYDCLAKFADDTVVVALISDNIEKLKYLENWCQKDNLHLNISKTKELTVVFKAGTEIPGT